MDRVEGGVEAEIGQVEARIQRDQGALEEVEQGEKFTGEKLEGEGTSWSSTGRGKRKKGEKVAERSQGEKKLEQYKENN